MIKYIACICFSTCYILQLVNSTPQVEEPQTPPGKSSFRTWQNNTVPFTIDSAFKEHDQAMILYVFDVFQRYTCVKFKKRSNEKAYLILRKTLMTDCGEAVIGYQGEGEHGITMNSFSGCMQPGILYHEIMHILGFYHEERRTDRDNYIQVIKENVQYMNRIAIWDIGQPDLTKYPYDYTSIMHNSEEKAGKTGTDENGRTIRLKTLRPIGGQAIGQRDRLSPLDVVRVNDFYRCGQVDVPEPKASGKPSNPCNFDRDLCGYTQDYKLNLYNTIENDSFVDDFDWKRSKNSIAKSDFANENVTPKSDHTGKSGSFLVAPSDIHAKQDIARIRSPTFPAGESFCLRFFYFINRASQMETEYENTHGSLVVKIRPISDNEESNVDVSQDVEIKTITEPPKRNQKNAWFSTAVDFDQSESFQVIFEAHAGFPDISDIAIDDVAVYNKKCSTKENTNNLVKF